MKISMILTSLIIATGAMSLTACDKTSKNEVTDQSAAVIQESDAMKSEATDEMKPAPAPPAE